MRSGWSTSVALLPLLLLAGTGAAPRLAHPSAARASTLGAGLTRARAAGHAVVRSAAVVPEREFHAAPRAVSVGGDLDTGSRFSAHAAANDSEPVIVELQIGRIATRTVQAYRVGTEALVPMSIFLQMVEVRFRLSLQGQLEATIDPGGKRLLMDAQRDTISFGDQRVHVEPGFRLFANNELYIGADRLADLFQTSVLVSWEDLTVTFTDPSVFPIGRRLRRENTLGSERVPDRPAAAARVGARCVPATRAGLPGGTDARPRTAQLGPPGPRLLVPGAEQCALQRRGPRCGARRPRPPRVAGAGGAEASVRRGPG